MYIILVFLCKEILLKAYGDMLANKQFLKKKIPFICNFRKDIYIDKCYLCFKFLVDPASNMV